MRRLLMMFSLLAISTAPFGLGCASKEETVVYADDDDVYRHRIEVEDIDDDDVEIEVDDDDDD